jgi:hypothetical protein
MIDKPEAVHARIEALERQLLSLQQSLETVKGERELLLRRMFSEGIDVARSYGDNAFHLWGEQLARQFDLARKRVDNPDHPVRPESALLRERPQDGVLGFVDRAVVTDFQRRVETAQEGHRCSGCGHRWEDDPQRLRGVELCGDCWRKGQSAIFSIESRERPHEPTTAPDKPNGSQG